MRNDSAYVCLCAFADGFATVNYFSCSDESFPVKASLQQYVFANNGFHLTGVHNDACVTSSLDAAPATARK